MEGIKSRTIQMEEKVSRRQRWTGNGRPKEAGGKDAG